MTTEKPGAEKPFGLWTSPYSIESIFKQPSTPLYPFRFRENIYWLQALPDQQGRIALMMLVKDEVVCLTPREFNIRSKVHEYGGKCFCLHDNAIVFNNFSDGRLYRQSLLARSNPIAVTQKIPSISGYADLQQMSEEGYIVAVVEQSVDGGDNKNAIVAVNMDVEACVPSEIVSGSDFYASPVFDKTDSRLAWFEWNHPFMPWDQSRLCMASIIIKSGDVICEKIQIIVDEPDRNVCQPGFLDDGTLVFASDSGNCNWWNLFRWDGQTNAQAITQLTHESVEFGEAHWVFGQCRWVQTDNRTLLAISTSHQGDALWKIDLNGQNRPQAINRSANYCHLFHSQGKVQMVRLPEDQPGQIVELSDSGASLECIYPLENSIRPITTSKPEPIKCCTRDGETTRGYFYPPLNDEFYPPQGSLPPLIVMVHGGPTSRTNTAYHPLRQYFCALGFSVLDINHRGSTGYGRSFRQRLLGAWGEVDVMDIADGIQYLVEEGWVDQDAVFIRGGSAGGYSVLRTLTCYPEQFAGGACYYGIGNLITLSEITHKFEKKYTDRLIGESFDPETANNPGSLFIQRSPIFDMENLIAPLILFQGCEDKVVPPAVSREVVELLEKKGIRYGYTEYPGEGHGFRKIETRIDSLQKETRFFINIINESSQRIDI